MPVSTRRGANQISVQALVVMMRERHVKCRLGLDRRALDDQSPQSKGTFIQSSSVSCELKPLGGGEFLFCHPKASGLIVIILRVEVRLIAISAHLHGWNP